MDKKLRETTNLCVEIMDRKRQVKGKLGHVVQIGIAVRRKHDACIRMAMLKQFLPPSKKTKNLTIFVIG